MYFPDRLTIEHLREQYPVGCRVELLRMDDPQAPPIGTYGTVRGVDDAGSIMVNWDSGSSLSVAYGFDSCKRIDDVMIPITIYFDNLRYDMDLTDGMIDDPAYGFDNTCQVLFPKAWLKDFLLEEGQISFGDEFDRWLKSYDCDDTDGIYYAASIQNVPVEFSDELKERLDRNHISHSKGKVR